MVYVIINILKKEEEEEERFDFFQLINCLELYKYYFTLLTIKINGKIIGFGGIFEVLKNKEII